MMLSMSQPQVIVTGGGGTGAACPVQDFLGPAVLAVLNRELLNREARDRQSAETSDGGRALLELAEGERGVRRCQRALECSRVCPTAVYPAWHIQELRNRLKE